MARVTLSDEMALSVETEGQLSCTKFIATKRNERVQ